MRCVPDVVVGRCVPELVGVGLLREESDWSVGRFGGLGQGRGGHFDQVRVIVMILLAFACSNVHSLSTPTASLQHLPSARPRPPFSSTPTNTHKSARPNCRSRVHGLAREVTSELQPCKRRVRAHREFCCVAIKVTTLVMNPPRPKEELK
jgi:hypothetical protein